jgi:hypothetical protein
VVASLDGQGPTLRTPALIDAVTTGHGVDLYRRIQRTTGNQPRCRAAAETEEVVVEIAERFQRPRGGFTERARRPVCCGWDAHRLAARHLHCVVGPFAQTERGVPGGQSDPFEVVTCVRGQQHGPVQRLQGAADGAVPARCRSSVLLFQALSVALQQCESLVRHATGAAQFVEIMDHPVLPPHQLP